MREEEKTQKDESSSKEEMEKNKNDSLQRDTMISFLYTTKLKANTMLQDDSWL